MRFTTFFAALVPTAQLTIFAPPLAAAPLPREIASALANAGIPSAHAAFLITALDSGATLLSHNAEQPMNPASVMKLVTTAAALEMLGPNFTWRTDWLTTSAAENGVLKSPLYIRASGDPKFTFEDLERVLARVRGLGVNELAGGVVIDKRVFAPSAPDAASFDRSPLRPYNVTPDAMLFNFKAVGFKLTPDLTNNAVRITPEPFPEGVTLDTTGLRLTNGPCGDWKTRLQATFEDGERVATARFAGSYSTECADKEWFVSLLGHEAFFDGSLRWMWKKLGGGPIGSIRTGEIPANARPLIETYLSPPLSAAVADVNKFSNNVMARHLLLTLDAQKRSTPATAPGGAQLIAAWLRTNGIPAPELVIENGSGLSRVERISPRTLEALLRWMHRRPHGDLYRESMPVAGVDGTLSTRFGRSPAQASAWLKTGGLNDVRALAGYLRRNDGRWLLYVGIINHPRAAQAFGVLERGVEWAYAQ